MRFFKWKAAVLSLIISTVFTMNAFAEWRHMRDGSWKFYNEDGSLGTNKWAKSGEDWYHFDGEGTMDHNTLVQEKNGADTYYVDDSGKMIKNKWVYHSGNYYYTGSNGKVLKNKTAPDGKTVDANGAWDQSKSKNPQLISAPISSSPAGFKKNSADKITVMWTASNQTGKKLKYYNIDLVFINRVDDPAFDTNTGASAKTLKCVGPVEPKESLVVKDPVGSVPDADKIIITNITLEYFDGTKEAFLYGYELKELK